MFASFSDGFGEVVVKGGCRCAYQRCLVVGADDGELAVVPCPKSEKGENDGCVENSVVMGVEENGGEFLMTLLFANREDGVLDVDGLLEGKAAGFRELLVCVDVVGEVEQVEGAGDAGVRRKEFCCLVDGC